jgi:3-deoxy-D-manno-octulosonic-acid transferase
MLPWDRARAVGRWLRRVQPDAVIVIECEIWPNLFVACHDMGIPLFIASGRLYRADVPRYRLARPFFRRVLECTSWIGVQRPEDRDAFVSIGASADKVAVAGNLKYDAVLPVDGLPAGWQRVLGAGPIVVGGSTHAPEEELLCDTLCRLRGTNPDVRLVLAPRHVGRTPIIERLAARRGLATRRWSDGESHPGSWDVLIVDRLGWLASLYRHADVAVLGGTIGGRGGQNVLEPAAAGCAIVTGPCLHLAPEAVDLERAGALRIVRGHDIGAGMLETLTDLLQRPGCRHEMGERARRFVDERRGPAAAHWREIVRRLSAPESAFDEAV